MGAARSRPIYPLPLRGEDLSACDQVNCQIKQFRCGNAGSRRLPILATFNAEPCSAPPSCAGRSVVLGHHGDMQCPGSTSVTSRSPIGYATVQRHQKLIPSRNDVVLPRRTAPTRTTNSPSPTIRSSRSRAVQINDCALPKTHRSR